MKKLDDIWAEHPHLRKIGSTHAFARWLGTTVADLDKRESFVELKAVKKYGFRPMGGAYLAAFDAINFGWVVTGDRAGFVRNEVFYGRSHEHRDAALIALTTAWELFSLRMRQKK